MKNLSVSIFVAVFMTFVSGIIESMAGGPPPSIHVSRQELHFASNGSASPPVQKLTITNGGGGTLEWGITDDAAWLSCSPSSGTNSGEVYVDVSSDGIPRNYGGILTIISPFATNSPQTVLVDLTVKETGSTNPPFGAFDTPAHGATVRSSIPVTGWVLDDVGVSNVKIYRSAGSSLVYIGDASFAEGARPDIEAAYPSYPSNYKAGWGYMMLTNFLPNGGNGTYTIHAIATDSEGKQTTLGSKTITCDNANAVKPFGDIDTPTQGGSASGSSFINWGWVLTPQPNEIPRDGSTINVFVDGVNKGHPTYDIYRTDIAGLFPGYKNSNGAAGYFSLDTTAYDNGVHTIQWTATDDAGNTDGIGSRYFNIQNAGSPDIKFSSGLKTSAGPGADMQNRQLRNVQFNFGESNIIEIDLSSLFTPTSNPYTYFCYQRVGGVIQNRPIGAIIIGDTFYWMAGPAHYGEYDLVFERLDINGDLEQEDVTVVRAAPATPANIPTMNEWGIIIGMILLFFVGFKRIRRDHR